MKKESPLDSFLKELWPAPVTESTLSVLKALHILTRDGKINQDSRRKLKQVLHFVQILEPHLENVQSVVDLGAGKSYLGFALYDLILRNRESSQLYAVEARGELVDTCVDIARSAAMNRAHFVCSSIQNAGQAAELPSQVDLVIALHACDTATDDAIHFGLAKSAKVIAMVPCCQAEVARSLGDRSDSRTTPGVAPLWRHPHHRREFGSHLTNVIRGLFLEANGYKVRVTELVGWEHSAKNEMILATKIQNSNSQAARQLDEVLRQFPVDMKLLKLAAPVSY